MRPFKLVVPKASGQQFISDPRSMTDRGDPQPDNTTTWLACDPQSCPSMFPFIHRTAVQREMILSVLHACPSHTCALWFGLAQLGESQPTLTINADSFRITPGKPESYHEIYTTSVQFPTMDSFEFRVHISSGVHRIDWRTLHLDTMLPNIEGNSIFDLFGSLLGGRVVPDRKRDPKSAQSSGFS